MAALPPPRAGAAAAGASEGTLAALHDIVHTVGHCIAPAPGGDSDHDDVLAALCWPRDADARAWRAGRALLTRRHAPDDGAPPHAVLDAYCAGWHAGTRKLAKEHAAFGKCARYTRRARATSLCHDGGALVFAWQVLWAEDASAVSCGTYLFESAMLYHQAALAHLAAASVVAGPTVQARLYHARTAQSYLADGVRPIVAEQWRSLPRNQLPADLTVALVDALCALCRALCAHALATAADSPVLSAEQRPTALWHAADAYARCGRALAATADAADSARAQRLAAHVAACQTRLGVDALLAFVHAVALDASAPAASVAHARAIVTHVHAARHTTPLLATHIDANAWRELHYDELDLRVQQQSATAGAASGATTGATSGDGTAPAVTLQSLFEHMPLRHAYTAILERCTPRYAFGK